MAPPALGFHLGRDGISTVALRSVRQGYALAGAAHQLFGAPADADFPDALEGDLKAMLKAHKLAGSAGISLPKDWAMLRNVTLPSTEDAELDQMARFEAERHIPLHADRHSIGYAPLRRMGVEGTEVLLGAIDGPLVQKALAAVVGAGLTPQCMTLSSLSLLAALRHELSERLDTGVVAALNIGLASADILFLREGRLVYARAVRHDLLGVLVAWSGQEPGATGDPARLAVAARMIDLDGTPQDPAEAESIRAVHGWVDQLMMEFGQTWDYVRREHQLDAPGGVFLTGEGATIRRLDQRLSEAVGLAMTPVNPVASLDGADQHKLPFEGRELTLAFGAALGPLQRGDKAGLDLTPADHYRRIEQRRAIRDYGSTGALALVTLVLLAMSWMQWRDFQAQTLQAYQSAISKMRPQVAELTEMETKLRIIGDFIDDPHAAMVVLNDIAGSQVLARNANLRLIEYEKERDVRLEGYARSVPTLSRLQQDLRDTGHFTAVNLSDQSDVRLEGVSVYQFRLDCPLKSNRAEGRARR